MATHANSTPAPARQRGLLPLAALADVEAQFAGLVAQPWPELPPEPSSPAAKARTLHSRRALERAADHGIALLAALNLPQLGRGDITTPDATAIGDALDVVIAHLDALDAPGEDLEDGGDTEDDGTAEPILGAPEEHPFAPMFSHFYKCRDGRQLLWGQGCNDAQNDGESEPGYDLACDEDELDDDRTDEEPSIGWPNDFRAKLDPNQTYQASMDREEVNEDGSGDEPYPWRLHSPDALRIAAEICDG